MREYEFTFVVQPEISDEGLVGLCEKLEGVLEQQSATRLFYEDWGRRRLAYEIQKFQKGHYLVLHFLDEGQAIPELERAARLEDSVLRFLTVLADDDVEDIEARKGEAVQLEEERKQKAAERAARDAEEAAARAAEAEEARAAADARAAAAEAAEAEAQSNAQATADGDESPAEAADDTPNAGGDTPSEDATSGDAPSEGATSSDASSEDATSSDTPSDDKGGDAPDGEEKPA